MEDSVRHACNLEIFLSMHVGVNYMIKLLSLNYLWNLYRIASRAEHLNYKPAKEEGGHSFTTKERPCSVYTYSDSLPEVLDEQ